ncbi:hypothetical protein N7456_005283 [Penicillium angulare]|uniref:GP-PDE domain-containing protein n=1 Tax=Penicillium angulare TaxID=116970 RepID=A0A9W9FY50_9EURO|nr:hypothetical protein N7456_005283 [Penicillium angulare]
MIHKSGLSAQYLLVEGFSATGVIPDHSLLNIILISASQKNHLCDHLGQPQDKRLFYKTCGNCEEEHPLTLAVEHLCSVQKDIVFAKDYLGRLPLHYGALYGREAACKTILRHAKVQGQGSSHILSPDARGYTPFHYAVVENNFAVAQVFLNALVTEHERDTKLDGNHMNKIQELLNISIRYQLDDMVLLLGASQLYSGKGSGHEESPLYVAAEIGREDYLQILLDNGQVKNIDDSEKLHGWSALFIACVKGHRNSVKVLLRYGASQEICDSHGWYAKEHAFLRGHFSLTELFKPWDKAQVTGGPASMHVASPNTAGLFLSPKVDHVIVNIGVLQHIGRVMGVDLGISSSQHKAFTGTTPSVDMSISNELEIFGINRESLLRARTIPILESDTCESLGTVTFTFLIIKGNAATNEPAPISSYVPEKTTQLVGHRGFGQNSADRSHLQLGENTVQSMLSAAKQGASYVEFDVQLTRDLVPVIFHDFSLSESGTDIPIHDLTFKQFMLASNIQSPREASELIKNTSANHNLEGHDRNRSRSRSLSAMNAQEIDLIHDRMRFTVDFKNKGFKPNTRGDSIHGPFTTLEKLLVELPESISFNAEIKYPRIHEAVEAGIAPVGLEINEFVDRILDEIFRNARGRKIILSSFTPEICILLTVKQQKYPVMFITNAGKLPANDMETRASSLQAAVRFSKRWDLAGIVFASDIFLLCPRLVGYVKQSGFVCGSYGTLNNDPESVRLQQAAGIQMLMADRVGFVSKVLNEGN